MRGPAVRLLGLVWHLSALLRTAQTYKLHHKQESFIRQLSAYEIITPVRLNDFGESFPHRLHYRRRRRSADAEVSGSRAHYRFEAFGQAFHLNLTADSGFIAPSYTVLHLGEEEKRGDAADLRHCFFRGHVNDRREHHAIFSLCTGLIGTFTTHSGQFFLEPLLSADGEEYEEEHNKPHLLYRHESHDSQPCSIGTFTTHSGQFFLEPLLSADGEEYEEEHNKPHLLYRHESHDSQPCSASDRPVHHISLHSNRTLEEEVMSIQETMRSEDGSRSRRKRFLSYPRFVELMVTADAKMVRHHRHNLEHYILTIMSVVAAIYRDPSVGNLINIVIVKLIVIHNEQEGPNINFYATATLHNFCMWQQSHNVLDDSHPGHHDTALLITREDICRAKDKCDTLGKISHYCPDLLFLQYVCGIKMCCMQLDEILYPTLQRTQMKPLRWSLKDVHQHSCVPRRAVVVVCLISQLFLDSDIRFASMFNMPHDDSPKCREAGIKHQYHVMAPTLNYDTSPWSWSKCSRKYITDFLDTGYGECLLDEPLGRMYNLPNQLPGQLYNANRQCELMFGPGSQVCPFMKAELANGERRFILFSLWLKEPFRDVKPNNSMSSNVVPCSFVAPLCVSKEGTGYGECLLDEPLGRMYNLPNQLPGQLYNANRQCELMFGPGSQVCPFMKQCKRLWCTSAEGDHKGCRTQHMPLADGTECGYGMQQLIRENQIPGRRYSTRRLAGNTCRLAGEVTSDPHGETSCQEQQPSRRAAANKFSNIYKTSVFFSNCLRRGQVEGSAVPKPDQTRPVFNPSCPGVWRWSECLSVISSSESGFGSGRRWTASVRLVCNGSVVDSCWTLLCDVAFIRGKRKPASQITVLLRGDTDTVYHGLVIASGARVRDRRQPVLHSCQRCAARVRLLPAALCLSDDAKHRACALSDITHCRHGMCVNKEMDMKPVHGEWGPWGPYSVCSRTCGGGTRSTTRDCNKPEVRVRFDILMKDRCKLFCRVAGTMAYYQLRDRVVDGTPCGLDTYDICVQGLCRQAGCDHVLNSKARNDKCGICGGDNSSCKTLAGTFNNSQYGYNVVVRIPAGATNIDIKQVSYSGLPEDDNYLALSDNQSNFLLNGNFVVSMFKREITFKGAEIEYSGSNTTVERINCTQRIEEELVLQVLCVGNLYNPDVRYSFSIPIEEQREQFVWDLSGPWQECSRMCQGERRRKAVCVRKSDHLVVSEQRCENLPRPRGTTEPCNTDCELRWHVAGRSDCSSKCGPGYRALDVLCMRYSQNKRLSERMEARACADLPKPERSDCSSKCGPGYRALDVLCMRYSQNKRLSERMEARACADLPKPQTREGCHGDCLLKSWQYSTWSQCLVTCGKGVRHRQVLCILGDEKLNEQRCDPNTKPSAVGGCELPECASWQVGAWSPCTVSCGQGYQMRAVRCVSGAYGETVDDRDCNAATRPRDSQDCELSACPRAASVFNTPRPAEVGQRHTQWRYGSWTSCSVSCGEGRRERYVSCRDAQGGVAEESSCAHLPRPPDSSVCFSPCGQWREGEWTPGGVAEESSCAHLPRPPDSSVCFSPCGQWREGEWTPCSSSCEGGFQRRVVVCQDADGRSTNHCDERVKPDQSKSCDSGPCPHWNYGVWGQCSRSCGGGQRTRLVVCQRPSGQRLNEHSCDALDKPADVEQCNGQPCAAAAAAVSWHRRAWKPCSVSCGKGIKERQIVCVDQNQTQIQEHSCAHLIPPRTQKACRAGPCPSWRANRWRACSASCGAGLQSREVFCRSKGKGHVSDELCYARVRPDRLRSCFHTDCQTHSWTTHDWKDCSASCGRGVRSRSVFCVDGGMKAAPESMCDASLKPHTHEPCHSATCLYIWISTAWSQCSVSCGSGLQRRALHCSAVTSDLQTYSHASPSDCIERPPADSRPCVLSECPSAGRWSAGPWSKCSQTCGAGVMHRTVQCLSAQNLPSQSCPLSSRPETHATCRQTDCELHTSCREVQVKGGVQKDGEHYIKVQAKILQIYCAEMQSGFPKEYVTLPSGQTDNYSEVYRYRLQNPFECPYNGSRRQDCACRNDYTAAGYTVFHRVRLDLSSMCIIPTDLKFSQTLFGRSVPFASAGDCYSAAKCPQGQFSINLSGTGLKVAESTKWVSQGNYVTVKVHRSDDGSRIYGRCGGFCGKCLPHPHTGLFVKIQ
ncbi:A disintegrin and metalloproteinase with thrombospondin motifs 20-like [Sinocyclocheilus anshuiensis]|uniref:A disintegrin and metalloproteinase with thrombospondin motifs 20-like n=1 Tax=Sinocyclocheilus anshuiensis TaxID=1608454 RepID=UPI0007B94337|nr:PREDICTED: A disintegrin and metalloproteinase with thrombospondin motifs 20-like [Sinocyclocheilus anshuiensis]